MDFCSTCGQAFAGDAGFCGRCGTARRVSAPPQATLAPPAVQQAFPDPALTAATSESDALRFARADWAVAIGGVVALIFSFLPDYYSGPRWGANVSAWKDLGAIGVLLILAAVVLGMVLIFLRLPVSGLWRLVGALCGVAGVTLLTILPGAWDNYYSYRPQWSAAVVILAGAVVAIAVLVPRPYDSSAQRKAAARARLQNQVPIGYAPSMLPGQPMPSYGMPMYPAIETPEMYAARGLPSIATTVIITVLFGLFGLIPASMHANQARAMGLSGRRYWKAFWITTACNVAIGLIVFVALWVTLFAVASSYNSTY